MTATQDNPLAVLPPPAAVHAHIGQLLRELKIARRLFKVVLEADEQRQKAATNRIAHVSPGSNARELTTAGK